MQFYQIPIRETKIQTKDYLYPGKNIGLRGL